MAQDDLKKRVAQAAIEYIKDTPVIGVGTGSTVNYFIDFLADFKSQLDATVSSSEASTKRLRELGIPVVDLNEAGTLDVYVDGADEIDPNMHLIKGGGGALTREKIIAQASRKFVCIADESKCVGVLGKFPLPVEVIPMARSYIARELVKLGGQPQWRENCITDNGNHILDVHNLDIVDPIALEKTLNNLPGVVTVGIFALRPADVALIGSEDGVRTM